MFLCEDILRPGLHSELTYLTDHLLEIQAPVSGSGGLCSERKLVNFYIQGEKSICNCQF